jgi:2-polyprenyl-6-methoxyphenol hydroxylase-like FAD-dependent oxidoreductase
MRSEATSVRSTPVVIVGAGPSGLAMALALARHGVNSVLLERRESTSRTSKAPGLHVRTREILSQWGVEDRFIAAGRLLQPLVMHSVVPGRKALLSLDFSELAGEADRPGLLILEQCETERLLLEAVRESGMCELRFGAEAIALDQDTKRAHVRYRSAGQEYSLDAGFVVGCDGAGSFVREALGLPFPGDTYALRPVLADVRIEDDRDLLPDPRAWTGQGGYAFAVRLRAGLWRLVHLRRGGPESEDVQEEEVRETVELLLGPGPAPIAWASRFRIHRRASPSFRVGRVLLAGDAAHVHSPASGFGMNGGIQDAHNLAWKLAHALRGGVVERLLDSYEAERRPVVVETTTRHTDRITRAFIEAPPVVRDAAWLLVRWMQRIPPFRRANLRRMTMIDLDYGASPLLNRLARSRGVRLPNPLMRTPDGAAIRLYRLLPNRPVILDVAESSEFATGLPLPDVVRIGPGGHEEPTGLLRALLGRADGWILVRPDAHVAWARRRRRGMERAVRRALGLLPATTLPSARARFSRSPQPARSAPARVDP